MVQLRIEGENTVEDTFLHSSKVTIDANDDNGFEDKTGHYKKITLIIEAGEVPYLEVEEYLLERSSEQAQQGILVSKSRHLLNYLEIETCAELEVPIDNNGLEKQEMDRLVKEYESQFVSAIDDLEI